MWRAWPFAPLGDLPHVEQQNISPILADKSAHGTLFTLLICACGFVLAPPVTLLICACGFVLAPPVNPWISILLKWRKKANSARPAEEERGRNGRPWLRLTTMALVPSPLSLPTGSRKLPVTPSPDDAAPRRLVKPQRHSCLARAANADARLCITVAARHRIVARAVQHVTRTAVAVRVATIYIPAPLMPGRATRRCVGSVASNRIVASSLDVAPSSAPVASPERLLPHAQERVIASLHHRAQRLVASSERFCRMAYEFDEARALAP